MEASRGFFLVSAREQKTVHKDETGLAQWVDLAAQLYNTRAMAQ
jgi:hypothetical protein